MWDELGPWWIEELASDPAYRDEIGPWLLELLDPAIGSLHLDVGCGEGRLMAVLKSRRCRVIGLDINPYLLIKALDYGPVVRGKLPDLGWARNGAFDGAYVGLVLEHIFDESIFFSEVGRVVRPSGTLAIVINHPVFTAPDSSPMEDATGEILWRTGSYFERGHSDEPAGSDTVRFYHRTTGQLLTAASAGGWDLQRLEERPISAAQVERSPEYLGQEHIPRLMGARWRKR